jgi:hypothetical protein
LKLRHVSSLVAAAIVLSAASARADELRSDEGVAITPPTGWARQTAGLGVTTALKLERSEADAGAPHATIVVNILGGVQAMSEDKAFAQTRELLGKPGETVTRPSGTFLRIDFDYPVEGKALKARLYAALREKRLFYFIMTTTADAFDRDAPVVDQVVDGAHFFPAVVKPVEKPVEKLVEKPVEKPKVETAPDPQPAPVSTVTQPARPSRDPPAVNPATAPAPEPEPEVAIPPAESLAPTRKPEPAKPEAAKPEPAKPEATPLKPPVAPQPATVRQTTKENLLLASTLVAYDDQYDAEHRAAKNVVDPRSPNGWCSSPTSRAPHRFVFELARPVDLARVAFDDSCPDDPGFEDASARDVVVEGSVASARGPWKTLASPRLEAGKNDQGVDLPANETRWLRVGIVSNQGHPTLSRIMKVRAFAAEVVPVGSAAVTPKETKPLATDDGPLRLERLKVSKERLGPSLEPAIFHEGESIWVYFKPRALKLSAQGEYAIQVDLKIEDQDGVVRLDSTKEPPHRGKPPAPPYSLFVTAPVPLPVGFPVGAYSVLVSVHDEEAGTEVHDRFTFKVEKR